MEKAVEFLQNPSVKPQDALRKISFLRQKGVSDNDIRTAAKQVGDGEVVEKLPAEAASIPDRVFKLDELQKYKGVEGQPLYLSCKGLVYEVDPSFYGPGKPYHAFAGADCSRHLAKVVVGTDELNQHWSNLSDKELKTLQEWEDKYQQKYKIMGSIDKSELSQPKQSSEGSSESDEAAEADKQPQQEKPPSCAHQ
eukprot:TRINITY_DN1012_c2_g3_i1.p1 TRINITY_DN1012_c2_g3~~TRINITY_DN1012_c2_g3_i1.p1  ORF type:complete len:195 (+),score=50.62 TRINITY_DN1012_c2_g3_i1:87-671(+)